MVEPLRLEKVLEAVTAEIGSECTGLRLSPGGHAGDIKEEDVEELYQYVVPKLNAFDLTYLHIGTFEQNRNWHPVLRPLYDGVYFAGVGFDKGSGEKLLAENGADAIVYGKLFLANPDLPDRFRDNAPLNDPDQLTFYTPGEKGYTDYPPFVRSAAA